MKNIRFCTMVLALVFHAAIGADINAVYCIQEINNKAVDCCRNLDLNGDGLDDLLVSCGMPNGLAYAELINLKEKGFCVRRKQNVGPSILVNVPLCSSVQATI